MRPSLADLSDDDLLRLRAEASEALHGGHAGRPVRGYGTGDSSALKIEIGEIDEELERRGRSPGAAASTDPPCDSASWLDVRGTKPAAPDRGRRPRSRPLAGPPHTW